MHCMHACMRRRADMYSITTIIILATSLKLLIIKKSHRQQENQPIVETKTARYVHDIIKEKGTQKRN